MIRAAGALFGLMVLGCGAAGPIELPEAYYCPQAIGASCGPPAGGVQVVEGEPEPEAEPVDPHDAKAGQAWRDLTRAAEGDPGAPAPASPVIAPASPLPPAFAAGRAPPAPMSPEGRTQ